MREWRSKIEVKDLHEGFEEGRLTVPMVGNELARRVRKSPYAAELEDIAAALEGVQEIDDYDAALADLYDFGDRDKRIWINTL